MSRDYAKRGSKPAKAKRDYRLLWFGLLAGLVFGALAMGFAKVGYTYWVEHHHNVGAPVVASKPSESQRAVAKPQVKAPKFDFYNLLPKVKVTNLDDVNAAVASVDNGTHAGSNNPSAVLKGYLLQVAAFRQRQDAESMRARLILLGYNVSVMTVRTNGSKWSRVILGPFPNRDSAEIMQQRLAKDQFQSMLISLS